LSDLHISKWIPERSKALRKALGHALQFIKPALVWITGDLTGSHAEHWWSCS
jgi:predicted MPP superfamily phosphohydrolase